mmetsp:Transcript_36646/g.77989  ORF Transcript_36646/g.77989 Transcript_36646/m.77989 type:complete len:82 (-) Transcript_36646:605-850(-)
MRKATKTKLPRRRPFRRVAVLSCTSVACQPKMVYLKICVLERVWPQPSVHAAWLVVMGQVSVNSWLKKHSGTPRLEKQVKS